ncbi:universal stress protein [Desulfonatronovibrio magnus]|uniref:universal stress protein n=1 Tax=Desulfonatronovibrio magnus TaxID=698827 RepID=UPI0005EBDA10|nr:universal stress protein [Desulfonatronovibrio magnus]
MQHKILISVDESKNSLSAVQYVANIVRPDKVKITLINILDTPPDLDSQPTIHPFFKSKLQELKGQSGIQQKLIEQVLGEYCNILCAAGIPKDSVQTRIEKVRDGIAKDIISEAKEGQYDTLVIGRRGVTGMEKILLGSISSKIVKSIKNCSVWIIDKQ